MAANSTTFEAIETVFKQFGSGPDLYGAIKNLADAASPTLTPEQKLLAAADASINIMKVADALGSMFTAYAGKLGMPANIGSFASNLNKAQSRMANQGRLEVSDVSALVADVAAFASSSLFLAAAVNPALIPVAGALVLFGAATTVFGNTMDHKADKTKQLFIAEFGTQKLEAMKAYGDYSWGSFDDAFSLNYKNNPVMAPALQVIHAIDKNLSLGAAVELIGRAGVGGWLNGGKQKEASELLRVISKTLVGGDLSPATDLKTYATQLETVWPLIQTNAGRFRFITPGEAVSASSAKTEFGVFLALMQLNPVALVANNPAGATALQTAHPSLYADWNADKAARLYGDTTKQPTYSDHWYTDRAAMLQAAVTRNEKDIGGIVPGSQNLLYQDVASKTEVLVGAGANIGQRTIIRFGSAGAEPLEGGAFADRLYGGAGSDTLDGKGGADYLEGGTGTDTYRFGSSFGKDTVVDADGLGYIEIDGQTLGQAKAAGQPNTWTAKLGSKVVELRVYDDSTSATGKRLVIAAEGDSANTVTIQHFDLTKALSGGGYLGIKLEAAAKVVLSATATGTNPFEDPNFNPASVSGTSTVVQGGGQRLAVYLNRGAKAGDTLTLSLSGAKDKFLLILGDSTVPADGAVITLSAGQTEVMVALVQQGDVTANASLSLSVAYQGVNEAGAAVTAKSNAWTVALKDVGETNQKTCQKRHLSHVLIGFVAMNTNKTSQAPHTTQATCNRNTKSRAMKQMNTCARGVFDHKTNAIRQGGMRSLA